jgi:acetyltransferase
MSFDGFFNPKSVAIVGASQNKGKVGYEILNNMIESGFEGKIFPINPKAESIQGLQCYGDLESTGQTPDLVIVIVPAKIVPAIMQQCAVVGVKAVVIITAGFKEVGEEGRKLEKEISQIARRAGIRMIGPNCLGIIVPENKLNASFGGSLPKVGSIGYLSQSGALLTAILDMANAGGIGFSKLVSIGNKTDVNELDLIKALASDSSTKVIAGYLESITHGDAFVREAEQISQKKPILLVKSGGTSAGAKAASSHTGSLAGSETAYEAVFERAGIIRCDSIRSQFDYAQALAYQPLPKGKSVAVITNAGGPGIMATDAIIRQGLDFAEMSDATVDKLAAALPPAANCHNPIDVLGDALADRYETALDIVLDDPNVDAVVIMLTPQAMTQAA